MRDTVRFLMDGELREIAAPDPTMTVLDYLRGPACRPGTKEGCAEGDCGACTVVLGELAGAPDNTHLRYRAVNACIQFVPMLDGKELITVEDLAAPPSMGFAGLASVSGVASGMAPGGGQKGPQGVAFVGAGAAAPVGTNTGAKTGAKTGDDAGGQGDAGLHPVQAALVNAHASQCGFCTPGFVMSLYGALENARAGTDADTGSEVDALSRDALSRDDLKTVLAGNLCRCTGYGPILDGALAAQDALRRGSPKPCAARAASRDALAALGGNGPLGYQVPGDEKPGDEKSGHAKTGQEKSENNASGYGSPSYDTGENNSAVRNRIGGGTGVGEGEGVFVGPTPPVPRRFSAPCSIDALIDILAADPHAHIVAGLTDVGLWVTKAHRRLASLVSIGQIAALRTIVEDAGAVEGSEGQSRPGWIDIGAGVTLSAAHGVLARHYPALGELIRRFASVQIRNVATLGGNIANGSPIGDMAPPLIALGARLVLNGADGRREIPLEDFFIAYGKQDLQPGEFVERVLVPVAVPKDDTRFACWKISKRFEQDICAVCAAFNVRIDGDTITTARLAFGGMAGTPERASHAEAALIGQPWTEATIRAAMAALDADFTPLDDMRATARYRSTVARNLLLKFYMQAIDSKDVSGFEIARGQSGAGR